MVDSTQFTDIKQQLLDMLATRGTPRVFITDANAFNRGELRIDHQHEGLDIQLEWASQVLGNLARIWSRPVHLDTEVDGKGIRLFNSPPPIAKRLIAVKGVDG